MISNRLNKIIVCIILLIPILVYAQNRVHLLKAGFLAKFAQFTTWPADYSPQPDKDKFIITIIGKDPFYDVLQTVYQNQKIKGCDIQVRQIQTVEDIDNTHILFISKNMKSELTLILEYVKDKPIMTVSDSDGFGRKGVLINFYITEKGTLHFEFNSTIMKRSSLKINLLLLEIAKVIQY